MEEEVTLEVQIDPIDGVAWFETLLLIKARVESIDEKDMRLYYNPTQNNQKDVAEFNSPYGCVIVSRTDGSSGEISLREAVLAIIAAYKQIRDYEKRRIEIVDNCKLPSMQER